MFGTRIVLNIFIRQPNRKRCKLPNLFGLGTGEQMCVQPLQLYWVSGVPRLYSFKENDLHEQMPGEVIKWNGFKRGQR